MKKSNHLDPNPSIGDGTSSSGARRADLCQEALIGEIRAIWDLQNRCIDRALTESEKRPHSNNPSLFSSLKHASRRRNTEMVLNTVVALLAFLAFVYWTVLFPSLIFSTSSLIISLTIDFIYLIVATNHLYKTARLFARDPSRAHVLISSTQQDLRQPTALFMVFIAILTLTMSSYTTTGIDGYAITQIQPDRDATVEMIINTLSTI